MVKRPNRRFGTGARILGGLLLVFALMGSVAAVGIGAALYGAMG